MEFSKSKLSAFAFALMAGISLCGAANAGPSICDSISGNLVQNCGFEAGSFASWGTSPAASGSNFFVGAPGNSGSFNAWFGATQGQFDVISQGIPTTPGHLYELIYFSISDGSTPNALFSGYFDGSFHPLDVATDIPQIDWTQTVHFFVATTNAIGLIFGGLDQQSFLGLDDVILTDVTPIPEPLTLSIFGAGLAGAAAMRRFKKKKSV
jgi:hypothetical protein